MAAHAQKGDDINTVTFQLARWQELFDSAFVAQWDALTANCILAWCMIRKLRVR